MNDGSANIIITGVGGQGNVLAAKLLAAAALEAGYQVSVGDVFGLSQRGGSVASHVRWTMDRVLPPLVPGGSCDLLLAFEPLEALRILTQYGTGNTIVVTNSKPVPPVGVQAGRFVYPDLPEIKDLMQKMCRTLFWADGTAAALSLNNIQLLNTVMLGALWSAEVVDIQTTTMEQVIRNTVPAYYKDLNIKAFRKGKQILSGDIENETGK